jgi:predicted RNase H-like nuclease (RuvC/YqgF family)
MANFNNQFATQKLRQETSVTGTGAGMTPSTVNNPTNQDWYTTKNKKKVKKEVKDVEPKLAAGKAKVYMKDKWGWKEAPSIPNRPSEGGFMYSQIFEELSNFLKTNSQELARIEGLLAKARETKNYSVISAYENRIKQLKLIQGLEKKLGKQLPVLTYGQDFSEYINSNLNKTGEVMSVKDIVNSIINSKTVDEDMDPDYEPEEQDDDEDNYDWFTNRNINESYSKFKTETKTRGKSDQFHQAVREVRRKVQEINRLFEYVSRLKSELSEGEGGLKYKVHTEKALAKIKEMVSELNQNIKKFK